MSATQQTEGPGNDLVVPVEEITSRVVDSISGALEAVGPCTISIDKYWSEEKNMYEVQAFVHDPPPDDEPPRPEMRMAMAHLYGELYGLYRIGFGRLIAEVSITSGHRRAITITAGATRRFSVPFEEPPV